MFDLNLDADVESWNRETIGSIDDCFLVFVGGNYISNLDQVVEKVESIGKKLQSKAKAIFINSLNRERINIKETWPPLVNKFRFLDDGAKNLKFQVYFPHHFKAGIKFSFSLQCPGEFINNVLELELLCDGTGRGNVHFYDLCKVVNRVNIAYNNYYQYFNIDNATNTIVKDPPVPINEGYSLIPYDFEIIGEFLRQQNIIPTWIDCNFTYGWYDEESGNWTGEIGKVSLMFLLCI